MDIIKEACVEGYQEAIQAKKLGADRIELCSSLNEDGLTPDRKTITSVFKDSKNFMLSFILHNSVSQTPENAAG